MTKEKRKLKKGLIVIIFLLTSLLFAPISYCKQLTEWESKIYYEYIERLYSLPKGVSDKDYERIERELVNKYGITVDWLGDIIDKALDRELTEREEEILNEVDRRLDALPEWATEEDHERVAREVANKYGVTLFEIFEMHYRLWFGDWW